MAIGTTSTDYWMTQPHSIPSNAEMHWSNGDTLSTGGIDLGLTDLKTIDELKKYLDQSPDEAYTTEDQVSMAQLVYEIKSEYNVKFKELTTKIETLEKVNTEILDKLNYICERKRRSENIQYSMRG